MKARAEAAFVRFGAHFAVRLLRLRPRLLRLIAGPAPAAAPDLHPQARLVGRLTALPRPGGGRGIGGDTDSRRRTDIEAEVFGARAPRDAIVEHVTVAGGAGPLDARAYTPPGFTAPGPLLVFFHGGGFMSGSLDSHDSVCRTLADEAGVKVVSVGYRLAPENPFPAATDDVIASFRDIATRAAEFGADPARIAVGGDSAGGNLAAVVANSTRGDAVRPCIQLLIYPVTDLSNEAESYELFAKRFFLTRADIRDAADNYVPAAPERSNPLVSPLLEADLSNVPTAIVVTAVADPLRDEGLRYAERIAEAGVPMSHMRFPLIHGFVNMTESSASFAATKKIGQTLRAALDSL